MVALSSRYFSVRDNFITLHSTDADASIRPYAEHNRVIHADGTVDYTVQCANDNPVTVLWRKKIATFLAEEVIGLPAKGSKKYILTALPRNYALFEHIKGDRYNPRHDSYLWGCRKGHVFRSPAEFFFHAKWLLLGCPRPSDASSRDEELFGPAPADEWTDRCGCKYCAGTDQTYISTRYSNYHVNKRRSR